MSSNAKDNKNRPSTEEKGGCASARDSEVTLGVRDDSPSGTQVIRTIYAELDDLFAKAREIEAAPSGFLGLHSSV